MLIFLERAAADPGTKSPEGCELKKEYSLDYEEERKKVRCLSFPLHLVLKEREQTITSKKRMVVKYTRGIVQLKNVRKIFRDWISGLIM